MLPQVPELTAITQEITLNRSGLVADCIFPLVKTPCLFSYIDWTAELKELKSIADLVTCKSDANETGGAEFELKQAATRDRALMQVMDECCVVVCGDPQINVKIAAGKTRSLSNKLLIGREERAIDLATNVANYVNNNTATPATADAVIDGGRFNLSTANFNDPNFPLLRYLQGINENAKFGARNVMVTDLATINAMLVHPNFIGSGCVVDPITTIEKVRSLLGLTKICIADAMYNDGIGDQVALKKLWPAGTIFFAASHEFVTSQDDTFSFGIGAHTQPLEQHMWLDHKKGKGEGATMQKIGHDITEVVLSYKAATLLKIA